MKKIIVGISVILIAMVGIYLSKKNYSVEDALVNLDGWPKAKEILVEEEYSVDKTFVLYINEENNLNYAIVEKSGPFYEKHLALSCTSLNYDKLEIWCGDWGYLEFASDIDCIMYVGVVTDDVKGLELGDFRLKDVEWNGWHIVYYVDTEGNATNDQWISPLEAKPIY